MNYIRFPESVDIKIMHVIGEQMPKVIHGQTTILEHLIPNNLLNDYYINALGFPRVIKWLSRMAVQITHRYPHMKILEIGLYKVEFSENKSDIWHRCWNRWGNKRNPQRDRSILLFL